MPNKDIKDYASKGGKKRADSLTSKQRSISASRAAKARWKKYELRKSHVCTNMCTCVCGKLKYKHATQEALEEYKCSKII